MKIHHTHSMNQIDGQFDHRCILCGTASLHTLEQPCAKWPPPVHPSHRMITPTPTMDYCALCGKDAKHCEQPCAADPKIITGTQLPDYLPTHPSHKLVRYSIIPENDYTYCELCYVRGDDLKKPCPKWDMKVSEIHSSHKMVPSADIGSTCECDYCGGKNPDVLIERCMSRRNPDGVDTWPPKSARVTDAHAKPAVLGNDMFTVKESDFRLTISRGDGKTDRLLQEALKKAVDIYNAMTPAEKAAHDQAQREYWVRGEMGLDHGSATTRVMVVPSLPPHSYKTIDQEPYALAGTATAATIRRAAKIILGVSNEATMRGRHHLDLQRAAKMLMEIIGDAPHQKSQT